MARKKRLREVEQEISDLELSIALEQERLTQPEISSDYQKVADLCAQLEAMRIQLGGLMEEWGGAFRTGGSVRREYVKSTTE